METYQKKLKKMEEESFHEADLEQQPPADIIAFNELRSCADLYRMYDKGVLNIEPEFQRGFVWQPATQTRFIDSLIKQLPIPSMCFSLDYKTQRWHVVDGLQRMSTIIRFLSDNSWRLSRLDDINPKIAGKTVEEFRNEDSDLYKFYERVENLTLPITVLRCDYSQETHTNYLFTIFHRLNTGGTRLNNQEIRNCIFSGNFNRLLKKLSKNEKWRKIKELKQGKSYRLIDVEMILRFFAYYDAYDEYGGNLARFLNSYMKKNRDLPEKILKEKARIFNQTVDIIYHKVLPMQRRSNSLLEAVMFGVAKNIAVLEHADAANVKACFNQLNDHESVSPETLKEGISSKEKVINRLEAAQSLFAKV